MQDLQSMDETRSDNASKQSPLTLNVLIVYDDIAAGKRAVRVMGELGKGLGEDIEFIPLPWRFDLLADTEWRNMAARDAASAAILVIATDADKPIPPDIGSWFVETIHLKRGTMTAVVALLEPPGNPGFPPALQSVEDAARQAGLSFFAPPPAQPREQPV